MNKVTVRSFTLLYVLLFLISGPVFAQRTADLFIENAHYEEGYFYFEVHITETNDWGLYPRKALGNSSWYFNYNESALSNPVLTYSNLIYVSEDSGYTNIVEIVGSNIGITTQLDQSNYDGASLTMLTKTHIYTIRLEIDNPSAESDVSWNQIDTGIFNAMGRSITETYYGNGDISLPVTISNIMGAASKESGIILTWTVQSELNCLGFNIFRSAEESGTYAQINTELILGRGNASTAMDYHFNDRNVEDNVTYWYKIEEEMTTGHKNYYGPVSIVGISPVPKEFALDQNYPNPFNPETTVKYQLPKDGRIHIAIYSLLGEKVADLVDEVKQAGYYSAVWKGMDGNGNQVASGIYFIWMNSGEFRSVRKVTLLR